MDPDRWRRVEELYLAASEQSPAGRTAFLARACAGDTALLQEVESLLAYAPGADNLLQAAVQEVASQACAANAPASSEAGATPLHSRKLGRYELIERIGKGGMGEVYRALDPAIGRTVAIKTILANDPGGDDSALRKRLVREAQAAGRLSHPNIVAVHDVGEDGQTTYVVMEYVQGRTLAQAMAQDAALPSVDETLRIVQDCAAALDYAHGHGVIHRDVKPANIMLQADGVVKIADFGIAKVSQAPTLTLGAAVGSPQYMAPEQWRGETVTGKADQYALAAVAYAMLTGHPPFESKSVASLASMTLHQEPPSALTFNPQLPPAVDAVLRKALSKDAGARYPGCAEFASALRTAWESGQAARKGRAARRVAAAAVSIAALSIGGWFGYSRAARGPVKPTPEIVAQPPAQPTPEPSPTPAQTPAQPSKSRQPDPELEAERQLKQGNYTEAAKYFTQAIAANPEYRAYFGRATAYRQQQQYAKAIADYTAALGLQPDNAPAYHDRALCEARSGLDSAAADDYDHALKIDPNNPRTWNSRGEIFLKKGGYNKAKEYFSRAIELDGSFIEAYENRARAELKLNDAAGAKADTAKADALSQQKLKQ